MLWRAVTFPEEAAVSSGADRAAGKTNRAVYNSSLIRRNSKAALGPSFFVQMDVRYRVCDAFWKTKSVARDIKIRASQIEALELETGADSAAD